MLEITPSSISWTADMMESSTMAATEPRPTGTQCTLAKRNPVSQVRPPIHTREPGSLVPRPTQHSSKV